LPDVTELGNEAIAQYVEAGKVAAKVKRAIRPKIKPGVSVLEICKSVEDDIMSYGANPAFPCNLCINDIAAHYTALPCDEQTIPAGSLVKIDLGVHIQGFIVDTAFTVSLSPLHVGIVSSVEQALKKAISLAKFGTKVEKLGDSIDFEVRSDRKSVV